MILFGENFLSALCAFLWLELEFEVDVAGDTGGSVIEHRRREGPILRGVFGGRSQESGSFRVSNPNLSVLVHDCEYADGSGYVVTLRHLRITRRDALRFAATQRAGAHELRF